MSAVAAVEASLEHLPVLLTVEEAAGELRIGRTLAYELARRYQATAGTDGLPVVRLGGCLRVPTWTLAELISTGRVVCLVPRPVETTQVIGPTGEPDTPAKGTASDPDHSTTRSSSSRTSLSTLPTRSDDATQLTLVDSD